MSELVGKDETLPLRGLRTWFWTSVRPITTWALNLKLKTIVDADKWVEVIKHLSMMVYLGRTVYSKIAEANRPLLRRIFGRDAQHDCADLMMLGVDSRNTTLFVNPRWPVRVGIFVRFK